MKKTFIGITVVSAVCLAGCIYLYIDSSKIIAEMNQYPILDKTDSMRKTVFHARLGTIFLLAMSVAMCICSFSLILSSRKYKHFEELNYLDKDEIDELVLGEKVQRAKEEKESRIKLADHIENWKE